MKPTPARPPQKFDLAKFETMSEPFSIRVEKHRGTLKYEVTPPVPDEAGWTKERVRGLENWVVSDWSGGGHYTFSINDSSSPPQSMEWVSYYLPADFPEKIPPTLQSATQPITYQQQQPSNSGKQPMVQPFTNGSIPPSAIFYTQNGQPVQMQPQQQANYPQQAMQPTMQFIPQPSPVVAPSESSELRATREALAQAREQAAQQAFERRVAEMQAASDRRFMELQQLIQQMAQQTQRPAVDPAIEQMREQNRILQEQIRMQAEKAERDQLREQIRASQDESRRLADESNRRFEQLMREMQDRTANKGPDPQMMMLFQAQVEANKEIARNAQSQLDRVQNLVLRPQDVLQIAKDSSNGADQVAQQINRQWREMFDVQRAMIEQAAQINPQGGNEMIGLVRDASQKIGEWAEKYTGGKTKEAVASMNAQAEIARAQADVIKSQQDRMTEMARIEASMRTGQPAHQHAMPAVAGPAGDTRVDQTSSAKSPWLPPKVPRTEAKPSNGLNGSGLNGIHIEAESVAAASGDDRKVKGRTDAEWFGPMVENVVELRQAVALFIDGLEQTPPVKAPKSASPMECAFVIQQAATEISKMQIAIPAITDLLFEGMVPDFLDVLLPDAPQAYRDDVVKILMDPGSVADDDEDSGDNDDE